MKKVFLLNAALLVAIGAFAQSNDNQPKEYPGYKLVFHDEFDVDGAPNPDYWTYDLGHRNNEEQLYTTKNAEVRGGNLVITARKEDAQDSKGKTYHYTSSSIASKNQKEGDYISAWAYGRFEVRAKLPCQLGCWPAIWMLGDDNGLEWPYSGEIDIMEYYPSNGQEALHANTCWGTTTRWQGKWNSAVKKISDLEATNPNWKDEYHVWRMDWDKNFIKLYVDDELLNTTNLNTTVNPLADHCWIENYNPFRDHKMYLLLNLALGGDNGGSLANTTFPAQYLVDYVRIYQKDDNIIPSDDTPSGPNLVTNGGFEDVSGVTFNRDNGQPAANSLPGWDLACNVWNVYVKIEDQSADGGLIKDDNHQYISLNRYEWNGWGDGSIKQSVNVTPGHKYTFSYLYRFDYGKYKGEVPRTGFQVYDENQDGDILISDDNLDPTGSWTQVKGEFTAVSDKAYVRIFLTNPIKDWWNGDKVLADIDEVKLVDITPTSGVAAPKAEVKGDATPYYNITGQRIAKPQGKGIFIHNGKKYIIR